MKKRNIFALAGLSFALSAPVFADAAKPNFIAEAKAPAVTSPVGNAALACQIVSSMGDNKDPLLLTAAAQFLKAAETGQTKLDATKSSEGGQDDKGQKSGVTLTSEALFSEAKALAGSDKSLVAVIDSVQSASSAVSRGAVGGAKHKTDRVRAGATDVFTIKYRGNRTAEVAVIGDGDTDLDLFVYDENGHLICSDRDSTDRTYCAWEPSWTGKFKIKIENLGSVYNVYDIITN